jgi:hypothetical protein
VKSFLWLFSMLAPLCVVIRAHSVSVVTTSKSCAALPVAVQTINHLPTAYPRDWTVVIACSDSDWHYLQRRADALGTRDAFTNIKGKTTFIRGELFSNPPIGRPARLVLLHELGHITCRCGNEDMAENFAQKLYK